METTKGKFAASATNPKPEYKAHGNCKPQEPAYATPWALNPKSEGPRLVKHIHEKPWTFSSAPGKRESPEGLNSFHRVWLTDGDNNKGRHRWNRQRKKEYYQKQDTELMEKVPTMERFNKSGAHYVTWSHLLDGGTRAGGQEQKLDYSYCGWSRKMSEIKDKPSRPTEHFYIGKYAAHYDGVQHVQRIVKTGSLDATGRRDELQRDTRSSFDNRLKDDMIRANDAQDIWAAESSYDCLRPTATASCPQLGADWCNR